MRTMVLTWWCLGLVLGLAVPAMAVEPTELPEPYAAGPVASGYVEVNGVKLYHEIHGRGEPVLLLHGGLGSSEEFAPVIPALAAHYKVILYDRRGHGRSYDTPEPFVYAAMAAEARAFMDAIGVASAAVVGFSDGGVVGYHLASAYPGRVTRLLASGANYRVNGMTPATIEWIKTRMTHRRDRRGRPRPGRELRQAGPGRRRSRLVPEAIPGPLAARPVHRGRRAAQDHDPRAAPGGRHQQPHPRAHAGDPPPHRGLPARHRPQVRPLHRLPQAGPVHDAGSSTSSPAADHLERCRSTRAPCHCERGGPPPRRGSFTARWRSWAVGARPRSGARTSTRPRQRGSVWRSWKPA